MAKMNPEEYEEFWRITVEAAREWDPRLLRALLAAIVLRMGDLKTCENGCCTYPVINVSLEELHKVSTEYNLGLRVPEVGKLQLSALARELTNGRDSGQHH